MASIVPSDMSHGDVAVGDGDGEAGQESLVILQSLICLLRERNLLSRADIEELCRKVDRRSRGESQVPLPCCPDAATTASATMHQLSGYLGRRYGGKHTRM